MNLQLNENLIKQKGCIFCEEKFKAILFYNENFIVALDDFPLMEGHILIFSKGHFGCGGELPKAISIDLMNVKDKISSLLRDIYGKVSFYEHGRAGHCVSFNPDERLCHHFHLHALPLTHDISDVLDNQFQRIDMPSYAMISDFFQKYGEYLFFENNNKNPMFYPVVNQIPPHLLRTLVANALQAPERANWENLHNNDYIYGDLKRAQIKISSKR